MERQSQTASPLRTKLNLPVFVRNKSCCPIQITILKKQNTFREKFTYFPEIKYTIFTNSIRICVRIVYNFSAFFIFQQPAESPSCAPNFFEKFNANNTTFKVKKKHKYSERDIQGKKCTNIQKETKYMRDYFLLLQDL